MKSQKVIKRDFILPVLYLVLTFIFIALGKNHLFHLYIAQIVTAILLVLIWCILHKNSYKQQVVEGFRKIRSHLKYIFLLSACMLILKAIYQFIVEHLVADKLSFNQTQNDMTYQNDMMQSPLMAVLVFITSVFFAPVMEEFLFRHLIIGELGKKLNYIVMSVISFIIFSLLHVTEAKSVLELGPYLLVSFFIIYVYLKTGKSLATAISIHSINNFCAYFLLLIGI